MQEAYKRYPHILCINNLKLHNNTLGRCTSTRARNKWFDSVGHTSVGLWLLDLLSGHLRWQRRRRRGGGGTGLATHPPGRPREPPQGNVSAEAPLRVLDDLHRTEGGHHLERPRRAAIFGLVAEQAGQGRKVFCTAAHGAVGAEQRLGRRLLAPDQGGGDAAQGGARVLFGLLQNRRQPLRQHLHGDQRAAAATRVGRRVRRRRRLRPIAAAPPEGPTARGGRRRLRRRLRHVQERALVALGVRQRARVVQSHVQAVVCVQPRTLVQRVVSRGAKTNFVHYYLLI
jgi:hypothetical protein